MQKTNSANRITTSKHYAEILTQYNTLYAQNGKVNKKKFWREVIVPLIPDYSYTAFQKFTLGFETQSGLLASQASIIPASPERQAEAALMENLKDSSLATRQGIAAALNIGVDALTELLSNPNLLAPKDRIELLFKAMKSQDSRIMATAKVRQDNREEIAFQHIFGEAAYQEENV